MSEHDNAPGKDHSDQLPKARLVFLFAALGFVGGLAIVPFALALSGDQLAEAGISPEVVVLTSGLQSAVLAAAAAIIGVNTLQRAGLDLPYFRALVDRRPIDWPVLARQAGLAAVLGGLAALVIIALDVAVFGGLGPAGPDSGALPTLLPGLLASLYGGIVEEILLRLGLMTGLAALLGTVWRRYPSGAIWIAILLSAALFGLGHLPATAALVPMTATIVLRALVLNGIGGVLFGWLYWRYGLLLAMVSHLSADIVLQSIGAVLN